MIVKTEDKYYITFQIILSEKFYEEAIQNHMHLSGRHVSYYFISKYIVSGRGSGSRTVV